MKKDRILYLLVTIIFIVTSTIIISHTNLNNNLALSKSIQIILILALLRISYGCTLYIKKQYQKKKYSYDIILNLGLVLFIDINIIRQIILLIVDWKLLSVIDIYNNTLQSFSFFAILTLPCIAVLSIYAILTNIILIKKEGFTYRNLLGIILGFLAIIGLLGSQTLYFIISKILMNSDRLLLKKAIDISINVIISYLYTLILATLYCNIMASRHIPKYDKEYVIILGSMIRKDGELTPLLKARVDKAIEFAKKQKEDNGKDIIFIPSGGQGRDEVTSEAEAMKEYLLKQGIPKKNIVIENQSTSTYENMKYSNQIILRKKKDSKICFSTTNYHVFRSGVIASNFGMDCEGMGSKTKWYFYTNALIREFIANLVSERKKHIGLILIMLLSTTVLILLGYYFNLLII